MTEEYVPKSKRDHPPLKKKTPEEQALTGMMNSLPFLHYGTEADLFTSAMHAAKSSSLGKTGERVFIQEFAAALNRKGLLSNDKVQEFREYGYQYMRGFE